MTERLEIFHTNALDTLAAQLTKRLFDPPLPPDQNEVIIVQSEGMAFWLRLRIAALAGCAAGIEMLFPGSFCRRLMEPQPLTQDPLWEIYAVLHDPRFLADHPLPAHYLAAGGVRGLQLAKRMAQLFEDYLLYRHDLLLLWEQGKLHSSDDPQEGWQAALWRTLTATPRAAAFERVLDAPPADRLPPRVSVFGVSTLPPLFVRLLRVLSRQIPVALYLPVPTPHFFADLRSPREIRQRSLFAQLEPQTLHYATGHPLLAACGRQSREFQHILLADEDTGQSWTELPFSSSGSTTALGVLQDDILNLRERAAHERQPLDPADESLRLHCCYSPLREVEALHDQLLHALEASPRLQPSDILVLMADPEEYAPWVRMVFGSSEVFARRYRLADQARSGTDTTAQAFLQILSLPDGRQTAGEVLALLDFPAVRAAAGLTQEDLPGLRDLVEALNIRWGIGGREREKQGLPIGGANSWRFGLDRLMMGYATGETAGTVLGIAPFFPGNEFETAGRFAHWVRRLFDFCALLGARDRTLEEWRALFNQLGRELLSVARNEESPDRWLEFPASQEELAIPFPVIREYLRGVLQESGGHGAFLGGGVSFCALRPMRSVPFPVIALLGMDYNRFPRRDRRESFNLLQAERQTGDRSLRDDDCQLFLEALLAARERLIITYSGKSPRDGAICPPSVCLSELLDCAAQTFTAPAGKTVGDLLTVEHPLQPFSPRYFDGADPALFTYSHLYAPTNPLGNVPFAEQLANGVLTEDPASPARPAEAPALRAEPEELTLDALIRFWQHPARAFCQQALGLFFPPAAEELAEEESPIISGREAYELRTQMVDRLLRTPEDRALRDALRQDLTASGALPPLELGAACFDTLLQETTGFVEELGPTEFLPPQTIILSIGGTPLHGTLRNLTPAGPLFFRPANVKPADQIRAWLTHLFCRAADLALPPTTRLVARDAALCFAPLSPAEALEHLRWLTAQRTAGLHRPLPFFPRASEAYARTAWEAEKDGGASGRKSPAAAARLEWRGTEFVPAESADEYFALCFGAAPGLDDPRFPALAAGFWQPLLEAAQSAGENGEAATDTSSAAAPEGRA